MSESISPAALPNLRYLLLQIRNLDDPMREHEVDCFARYLTCRRDAIRTHNLIFGAPDPDLIRAVDAVLIGGSGDYSVVQGGPWLAEALQVFRVLYETSTPTFASCWGFQAFARALGGRVVTDLNRAETGTLELTLTPAGLADPVFSDLGPRFYAQLGHQDIVDTLPGDAVLLASSERVRNQAFTFAGKPIYGTQFHPELGVEDLVERLRTYPVYVERITGLPLERLIEQSRATPETSKLLERFAKEVVARARRDFR